VLAAHRTSDGDSMRALFDMEHGGVAQPVSQSQASHDQAQRAQVLLFNSLDQMS
jgi:hypothetical protein